MGDSFEKALARCLDRIPQGRYATCGAVARALGDVRAARAVATWLVEHPETPRGSRVVRADGRLVLAGAKGARDRNRSHRLDRVEPAWIIGSLPEIGFLQRLRRDQERLAGEVIERDEPHPIERVAGVDLSYRGDEMFAAAVSIAVEDLEVVEIATVRRAAEFPYIPTYLAYREFPGIRDVVGRLSQRPDVLMVDGHGRLHPALFGVACHVGVALNLPTIGVAKHPLAGRVQLTRERAADAWPVRIEERRQGYAWLPPSRSRPIYISVGHRISLESALRIVRITTRRGYPEALRIADRASRQMKRNEKREKGAMR